jgi:hypothetical protein
MSHDASGPVIMHAIIMTHLVKFLVEFSIVNVLVGNHCGLCR